MAIDVECDGNTYDKPDYPYLGISKKGTIVLFNTINSGVLLKVIDKSRDDVVGDYTTYWEETKFTPYCGTITLTNKQ